MGFGSSWDMGSTTPVNTTDNTGATNAIISGDFSPGGDTQGPNFSGNANPDTMFPNDPNAASGSTPPNQEDINNLITQGYSPQSIQTILGNIAQSNPHWASQLGSLVAGGVKVGAAAVQGLTGGGGSPTGTTTAGNNAGGGPIGSTNLPMLFASLAMAAHQYNNSSKYTDTAEKYAQTLNPYGAYRDAAAQKLAALQADPSSIANTPGYKFALQQGLGAVANRDNQRFGVGAGSTDPDMMNYAQGLASKTYNDTISQLSNQAGVGIGPQSAADMLKTGMMGSISSQNTALNNLLAPFGPGNNTGGAANNGTLSDATKFISNVFGGSSNNQLFPNGDPGNIVNNQQTPSVPVDPNNPDPNLRTVPNNNTGVAPGGT